MKVDFVNETCKNLDMKINWKGEGENEIGLWNGEEIIKVDKKYFRPTEVDTLLGDSTKAKLNLNWSSKISFQELVKEMTEYDLNLLKNRVV
jgi:GDPmannose 4,6-dehydratase